jgi:hypothetical protein
LGFILGHVAIFRRAVVVGDDIVVVAIVVVVLGYPDNAILDVLVDIAGP